MKEYKYIVLFIVLVTMIGTFSLIGDLRKNKNMVILVSSMDNYRNKHLQKMLDEKFKDLDVKVQEMSTGKIAAKIKAEGKQSDIDIVVDLETGHAESLKKNFANIDIINRNIYDVDASKKEYLPWVKFSGAFIINSKVIKEKGLNIPKTYEDLLKPEYKGLIAMPDPKSSGTGYMFYLNIINLYGEEEGLKYIDKLEDNLKSFTTSGSGPVKMLMQEEIAVGLGMITQSVNEKNKGANLEIIIPETGATWNTTSITIIKGKEKNENVRKVFEFVVKEYGKVDTTLYMPDKIYKNQKSILENYPQNIKYGDMKDIDSIERKEELISKWKY